MCTGTGPPARLLRCLGVAVGVRVVQSARLRRGPGPLHHGSSALGPCEPRVLLRRDVAVAVGCRRRLTPAGVSGGIDSQHTSQPRRASTIARIRHASRCRRLCRSTVFCSRGNECAAERQKISRQGRSVAEGERSTMIARRAHPYSRASITPIVAKGQQSTRSWKNSSPHQLADVVAGDGAAGLATGTGAVPSHTSG